MSGRRTTAEGWSDLQKALRAAFLNIIHALGLHTHAELEKANAQTRSARAAADYARAGERRTQRLLVILSEPLKDWDLDDFPAALEYRPAPPTLPISLDSEQARHLWNVIAAYRITAGEVAPLRNSRVMDDRHRRRGWDDQLLPRPVSVHRDPKRLP